MPTLRFPDDPITDSEILALRVLAGALDDPGVVRAACDAALRGDGYARSVCAGHLAGLASALRIVLATE